MNFDLTVRTHSLTRSFTHLSINIFVVFIVLFLQIITQKEYDKQTNKQVVNGWPPQWLILVFKYLNFVVYWE